MTPEERRLEEIERAEEASMLRRKKEGTYQKHYSFGAMLGIT